MAYRLLALRSVSDFDPSKGGALPQRIKLLGMGVHETPKGAVILNATSLSQFDAFQKSLNWDRISGDFEHNTVPKSASYKGEPAPIACNATVTLTSEGLFADIVNWTPEGRHFVGGGHFQDISPAVVLDDAGVVIGLDSFAFCRKGATPGAVLFSAAFDPATEARKPAADRSQLGPQTAEELLEALRSITGAAADASPTQILRALETALPSTVNHPKPQQTTANLNSAMTPEQDKQLKDTAAAVTTLSAKLDSLVAGIEKITGKDGAITALTADLDALKKQRDEGEREAILLSAAREGKVIPAESAKTLTNAQLKTLVSELPVTVPLAERTPAVLPLSAQGGGDPDKGFRPEIAKQLGLSKELYLKHQAA